MALSLLGFGGGRRPTGPSGSFWKLGLMCAGLIGVLIAMHVLSQYGERPEPRPETPEQPPQKEIAPGTSAALRPSGQEEGEELRQVRRAPTAADEFLREEAVAELLRRVTALSREEIRGRADRSLTREALQKDPKAHYGKVVAIEGARLVEWNKWRPLENPAGLKEFAWGDLADRDLKIYRFYLADTVQRARPGQAVSLAGFFLRLRPAPTDLADQGAIPILIGKRFDPPAFLDDPDVLSPERAKDLGTRIESEGLFYLIRRAAAMPRETFLESPDQELRYRDFRRQEKALRGRPVSVLGVIKRLRRITQEDLEKDSANPLGLRQLYTLLLMQPDMKVMTVYLTEMPKGVEENDSIKLYGLYYKRYVFVGGTGIQQSSPVLVGKFLRQVEHEPGQGLSFLIGVIALATLLVAGLAMLHTRREARRTRQRARLHRERHRPEDLNKLGRDLAVPGRRPGASSKADDDHFGGDA